MNHLGLGILRRELDEPQALLESQRRHLDDCSHCRLRSKTLSAHASATAAALGSSRTIVRSSSVSATAPPSHSRVPVAMWSACAAAAIALAIVATPLRTLAQNFLAIFEPRQFVALPISRADEERLRTLPDLRRYGTMRPLVAERRANVGDAPHAALLARIPVLAPSAVPSTAGTARYEVISRQTSAFTFSAAKAAAAATAAGERLPAMPPGIDGSTLEATVGPAVVAVYGEPQQRSLEAQHRGRIHAWQTFPTLMVVQMPLPVVASNGVSATAIVNYLTSQPSMPPQLVSELRAIADPASSLPIPFPIDRMHAAPVSVQNARGLGIGDDTGVGAGVIWQNRGYVYAVAGQYPMQTILSVANSLH